jgi:octaprenyl-diphosphate synthase
MIDDLDESNLKRIVHHVFDSGGKRIRPIILILSSELFGGDADECIDAALAIELIHSASLIHDDILEWVLCAGVSQVFTSSSGWLRRFSAAIF